MRVVAAPKKYSDELREAGYPDGAGGASGSGDEHRGDQAGR